MVESSMTPVRYLLYSFLTANLICDQIDVSAQISCAISPNITTLTIRDGLVRYVEFRCRCMDDNGIITTGTSWFHNGTLKTTTLNDPNDAHTILFIPPQFESSDSGTYTCSPNGTFPTTLSGDNITLYARTPTGSPSTCNIISTSLPTLTTPSGIIADGTENVILYCICMIDSVAVGPTYWFFGDTYVTATQANGNNPYYRNNVPSPLIIPLFAAAYVGTYRCESYRSTPSPDDSITLNLPVHRIAMNSTVEAVLKNIPGGVVLLRKMNFPSVTVNNSSYGDSNLIVGDIDDYKFLEMIRQKPSIATLSLNFS